MDVKGSHTYQASIDAVLAMFADPAAVVAKYEGMDHRDVEIVACERDETAIVIESSRVVDVDLPGFAKKVLKPTNTMRQTDRWTARDDGGWDGTFDVKVEGAPIELSGVMHLLPGADDTTCTHEVTITVHVKVPIIGGRIADWAGKNDVRRTLDAEFAFGDEWLPGHPE